MRGDPCPYDDAGLARDCYRLAVALFRVISGSPGHPPGLLVADLGDGWEVALNTRRLPELHHGWTVPPRTAHDIWNAWPVGAVDESGGHLATRRDPDIHLLALGVQLAAAIDLATSGHPAASRPASAN